MSRLDPAPTHPDLGEEWRRKYPAETAAQHWRRSYQHAQATLPCAEAYWLIGRAPVGEGSRSFVLRFLIKGIFLSETLAGGRLEVVVYVSRMPGVWRTQG